MKALQQKGVAVYLISGGFCSIIEMVAEKLNVPKNNIKANKILFYYNGNMSNLSLINKVVEFSHTYLFVGADFLNNHFEPDD